MIQRPHFQKSIHITWNLTLYPIKNFAFLFFVDHIYIKQRIFFRNSPNQMFLWKAIKKWTSIDGFFLSLKKCTFNTNEKFRQNVSVLHNFTYKYLLLLPQERLFFCNLSKTQLYGLKTTFWPSINNSKRLQLLLTDLSNVLYTNFTELNWKVK